jgi:DNA (cytosine-5)-methyltransferase 1
MNVLSLFDGMSCGQQALERNGIKVDNYFASEIDKYAITVTMANYPNTKQIGSVIDVDGYSLPKIDLLMGGSPCQSFSFAGKRKGMSTKDEQEILTLEHYLQLKKEGFEFEGQSYLFWEYMRLLNECKPKYFLLENVMMGEKWEKILSKAIGVNPIMINSSLLSAQNRQRLYWTNIGLEPAGLFGYPQTTIEQPNDKGILLKDVLESEVDEKYFLSEKFLNFLDSHKERHNSKGTGFGFTIKKEEDKANCLRANASLCPSDNIIKSREVKQLNRSLESGGKQPYQQNRVYSENGISPTLDTRSDQKSVYTNQRIRRLTPIECERLQTVKDNYTNYVSDSQRYKMLGNGWTIDVICHILNYIKQ